MLSLFYRVSKEIVTITIDEENLSLAWFKKDKTSKNIILNDYQRFKFQKSEIYNLIIFDFNALKNYINTFLTRNNLTNSFIYLSLSGNQISDQMLKIESNKNINEVIINDKSLAVNCFCINKDEYCTYYIAKIPYSLIFQYKLFSVYSKINLIKMMPSNSAILSILNYLKCDIISLNNLIDIENLFFKISEFYDIDKNIIISKLDINLNYERIFILQNLGLFILGNKNE